VRDDVDQAEVLCDAVRRAAAAGEAVRIVGSGSKSSLTAGAAEASRPARLLSVSEHVGIVDYRPEELVVTARAGTRLKTLESVLAGAGQYLPFEPPRLHGGGTVGGAVACGLSGPGRPWRGAVRDAVLGVELVNGRGERLRFGGQVMKNVAGYDLSRLQAGAFGTFGLMLAVSLKVLPVPETEQGRVLALPPADALARCRAWSRRPLPISGLCWADGLLHVRLSGAASAVAAAAGEIGGDDEPDPRFWTGLRDLRLPQLAGPGLWRCVLPPAAPEPLDECLVNWGGAERWWRPRADDARVRAALAAAGGHGRPFDGSFGHRGAGTLAPLERRVSERLRAAFDPERRFNPELTARPEETHAH